MIRWFFEEIWSCLIRLSHYKKLQQITNQESCSVGKECSYWCSVSSARIHWGIPIPPSISDEELKLNICQAGHEVKPNNLQACHCMKKKESVTVKFKCRKLKQNVLVNWENLWNKSEDLHQLKFLVSSSYRRACAMKTISWHINVVNWRMHGKSAPLGSGIMQ